MQYSIIFYVNNCRPFSLVPFDFLHLIVYQNRKFNRSSLKRNTFRIKYPSSITKLPLYVKMTWKSNREGNFSFTTHTKCDVGMNRLISFQHLILYINLIHSWCMNCILWKKWEGEQRKVVSQNHARMKDWTIWWDFFNRLD